MEELNVVKYAFIDTLTWTVFTKVKLNFWMIK